MSYRYKIWQELGWASAIALATYLMANIASVQPEDWASPAKLWVALGAGSVRAILGAFLAVAGRHGPEPPAEP